MNVSVVTKRNDVFLAYITVDSHMKILGRFKSLEDAVAARKAAEAKYDYHPNHGRAA